MNEQTTMPTIRDRIWLWGHAAGSHNADWNLPAPSTIGPVEAATWLGIPNLLMIRYDGQPAMPYDELADSMSGLRRVGWGITGARGETSTSASTFSTWRHERQTSLDS
jgi:hypothetical protein